MPWVLRLHLLTIILSLSGFIIRGIWMILDSPKLSARWVRIVPHINDSLLLLSGVVMVIMLKIYPWEHSWLATKLVLLLAYILLGTIALKRGKTKTHRVIAWILAILVFIYMLVVASSHNPLPF